MLRRRPIGRVGRPGLLGTVARTAVVAGTATAVSGSMIHHQQQKAVQEQEAAAYEQEAQLEAMQAAAAPVAAPAAPADDSRIDQLKELAQLKSQGILTEAEFEAEKARVLGS